MPTARPAWPTTTRPSVHWAIRGSTVANGSSGSAPRHLVRWARDLLERGGAPSFRRNGTEAFEGHQTPHPTGLVQQGVGGVWAYRGGDTAQEVLDGPPPVGDVQPFGHHVPHPYPRQRGTGPGLLLLGTGHVDHEPAQQHPPQTAGVPGQQAHHAQDDQQETESPPGSGRPDRRPEPIPPPGPQCRAQHPPSVQRGGRHHVEHGQDRVDHRQVDQDAHGERPGTGHRGQPGDPGEDHPDHHTGHRPNERDPQLGPRGTGLTAQSGDPAQQPQGDALHLYAVATRDDRVRHLVGQQRAHEQHRRAQPGQPVGDDRVAGEHHRKLVAGQADHHQQHDAHHAPVQPDPYPGQAPHPDRLRHPQPPRPGWSPHPFLVRAAPGFRPVAAHRSSSGYLRDGHGNHDRCPAHPAPGEAPFPVSGRGKSSAHGRSWLRCTEQ